MIKKAVFQFVMTIAIAVLSVLVTFAEEPTLMNGFLDKEYAVKQKTLDKALKVIFPKCVLVSKKKLKDQDGSIVIWGVGDKNGTWQSGFANWNGVATIEELTIKEGGINIAVKTARNGEKVNVGFKVGEGDKNSSEILHNLLADNLKE